MKKVISILLSFILLFTVGCSSSNLKDSEADSIKGQVLELQTKINTLQNDLNDANSNIEKLQSMMPKQGTGNYTVKATKLNMRLGPSIDEVVIGTLSYGTAITVVDTSNSMWYKVSLDLSDYKSSKEDYQTIYTNDKNTVEVKDDYNNKNLSFYVSSMYITSGEVKVLSDVPVGNKPFVYGLVLYDEESAKLLANEIWSNMQDNLKKLGYTGVKVECLNRETYNDDIKNGKFDAVESAPGQFATINKDKEYLTAFAKDKINGKTSYSGIIIVNKNSNIVDYNNLKGKTVLAGKEYSESSYIYQKYYLNEIQGIDAEKDLKLDKDHNHQEIFYKVATGEVDAGFCGDFVMTNSYGDMKENLKLCGIDLKSKDELAELRSKVNILNMSEISAIPNNPHAVKANTFDSSFVDKLYNCVKTVYDEYKEGYEIVDANNKEYKTLTSFE